MARIIERLQCNQLPGVTILGVGSDPIIYAAHMRQIIGTLLNKISPSSANASMHTFLKSNSGRSMPHGGDLAEASLKGPLTSMIYTHRIGVGAAKESNFLTMEGVKHVVETLPNQDENSRRKLSSLLEDHLLDQGKSKACFQPIPEEQFIHIEADEDDENSGGAAQETALIPTKGLYDLKIAFIRSEADKKNLQDKLEFEKERALVEKEKAQLELRMEKEKAQEAARAANDLKDKDIEIMKLKMQLEFEKEKAKMQTEIFKAQERSEPKKRAQDDDDHQCPPKLNRQQQQLNEVSSSPQLVMTPFTDDPSKANLPHLIRKYRWLFVYFADRALIPSDFPLEVNKVVTTIGHGNIWVSLMFLREKKHLTYIVKRLKELHSQKKISGKVAIEVTHGANAKLHVQDVNDDSATGDTIKHYMAGSSSTTSDENGTTLFKLRVLIE